MRIRHVLRGRCDPDNADGIIYHTYHLAHAQKRQGHDVEVYGVASRAEQPEVIDRNGLTVRAYPPARFPMSVHPALREHVLAVDRAPETIFHLQQPHDPAVYGVGRMLHGAGIPYMVTAHAMWGEHALARRRVKKRVYKALFDDRLNRESVGVHATAAAEVAEIHRYSPTSRVFAIRNSLDLDGWDALGVEDGFWNDRYGIPPEIRLFVFMGRLDPYQKGLDLLLEGWRKANLPARTARLALVGPPWRGTGENVEHLISQNGLGESVVLPGPLFRADKKHALSAAHVYVQTSRYETSPYSIQEAMASRLPVIVSPQTNFARVAEEYGAGSLVDLTGDSIARALTAMAEAPPERLAAMAANARSLVEERHSLDRAAERIVEAYRAALAGQPFTDDD